MELLQYAIAHQVFQHPQANASWYAVLTGHCHTLSPPYIQHLCILWCRLCGGDSSGEYSGRGTKCRLCCPF
jgi:hypothetical protein